MRLTFDKIPGCIGKFESTVSMTLRSNDMKGLKKILTVRNKAVAYKIKRAKSSAEFNQAKLTKMDQINVDSASDGYKAIEQKVKDALVEVELLKPQLIEQFFLEREDGAIEVPAGFYYLCSETDGSEKNTDLKPYFLPGLRDYQVEALQELYKVKRGTVELATGLGKSLAITSAALAGVKSGKRVMVVVPTAYLVEQMYKTLKSHHANTTAIGGEYKHAALGWDIIVTTINSAQKHIDSATMLLLDEAHHAPASTWTELLAGADKATHVYNFTATAFRADGLDLAIHAFGGPVVISRNARWGIDHRWLSKLKVIQVRIRPRRKDGSPLYLPAGTPATSAYKKLIADPLVAGFICDKLQVILQKKGRVMTVFKTVKAAQAFKKQIGAALEFTVAHADKSSSKFPKAPLYKFNKGEVDILVACVNLLAEGIDIPNTTHLLIATQHSGDVQTYQMVGRVLRKAPGKEIAIVLDVAVLGYDQFERSADARLRVYKELTDDVTEISI